MDGTGNTTSKRDLIKKYNLMGNQCCGNDTIDFKNTINTKTSDLQ